MQAIELDRVSKRFSASVWAMRDVAFTAGEGEFVSLLGPRAAARRRRSGSSPGSRRRRRARYGSAARRSPRAALEAQHRHRLPDLCAVSLSDGVRECRLRPEDAAAPKDQIRQPRRRGAGDGRTGRSRGALSAPDERRPAAARGACPRHGYRAAPAAARRAALQSRREAARRDAARGEAPAARERDYHASSSPTTSRKPSRFPTRSC